MLFFFFTCRPYGTFLYLINDRSAKGRKLTRSVSRSRNARSHATPVEPTGTAVRVYTTYRVGTALSVPQHTACTLNIRIFFSPTPIYRHAVCERSARQMPHDRDRDRDHDHGIYGPLEDRACYTPTSRMIRRRGSLPTLNVSSCRQLRVFLFDRLFFFAVR